MSGFSCKVSSVMRLWMLVVPFIIWLGIYNWGNNGPQVDNMLSAHWIAYHFEFLAKGIFPLWDPFRAWGLPDLTDPRFFGEYNPLYLIIPLMTSLHIPPFVAFNVFLCFFYFISGIGFYLLVKCIWNDEFSALLAYAMFVVSISGGLIFSQVTVYLIIFSIVWFFYFLVSFLKAETLNKEKKYFLGIIFIIMIIVTTYLPFFFLVISSAVIAAFFLTRPIIFVGMFWKIIRFAKAAPLLFGSGIIAAVVACLPGFFWLMSTSSGNVVFSTARNNFGALKGADIPLEMIAHSSLAAQVSVGELFSDQDFAMNTYCYLPIFLVVLLTLGAFVRMQARHRMLFIAAFLIFLFALAGVSPLHAFLYQHVSLVRMFRNLYLLGPVLVMLLVILGVGQLHSLLASRPSDKNRRGWYLSMIVCAHLAWLVFLLFQERVLWSSYATLALSAILFVLYSAGFFDRRKVLFLVMLMAAAILQPCELRVHFWRAWGTGVVDTGVHHPPSFAYIRPHRGQFPEMELGWGFTPKKIQDESGFLQQGYYGTKYAALLYSNLPAEALQEYVVYKFVVYDQVVFMDSDHSDWARTGRSLSRFEPLALVHDKKAVHALAGQLTVRDPFLVSGASDALTVTGFSPNWIRIQTNFSTQKFLVYNDSYYPGWKVFIDGKEQPLYRANIAFKGVWVEPGSRKVEFIFGGPGEYIFRWGLMGLFVVWGSGLIFYYVRRQACAGLRK